MKKRSFRLLLTTILAVIALTVSVYADRGWPTYTWQQVWDGAFGTDPVLNSIVDPVYDWDDTDFLTHQTAWESSAGPAALKLRSTDSGFDLYVCIRNANTDSAATAKGVKIAFSTGSSGYSKTQTLKAVITMENGPVRTYTDSLTVTADKPFHILPYNATGRISLDDGIFNSGVYVGSQTNNGVIQPDTAICIYAKVKVAYQPEKYVTAKSGSRNIAQAKAWNLIQKYSKPKYFLKSAILYPKYDSSTGTYSTKELKRSNSKYKYLKAKAKSVVSGKKTDYEKIRAVAEAVASRMYYHDAYLEAYKNKITILTNTHPADLWDNRIGVCSGYALLCRVMLDSLGIPCMMIDGQDHTYNAAYSVSAGRWIFFDSTWMCGNHYTTSSKAVTGSVDLSWFDFACDNMKSDNSHMIFNIGGIVKDNTVYTIRTDGGKAKSSYFTKKSKWFITPSDQYKKSSTLKIKSKVAGYKVSKILPYAFINKSHIKKIYIPSSVKSVGKWAFWTKKKVSTTVITKISKSKLKLKYWGWRKVRVKKK